MLYLSLINIDCIYNFLFIARGYAGSRWIQNNATGSSLLMIDMIQTYKARSWNFPLPISSTYLCSLMACHYRRGIYGKLIELNISQKTRELMDLKRGYKNKIERLESIRESIRAGLPLNERGSDYADYVRLSSYISAIGANTNAMNLAICLGFQVWYAYIPYFMLYLPHYTISELVNPEKVGALRELASEWSPQISLYCAELCQSIAKFLTEAVFGATSTEDPVVTAQTQLFDPLSLNEEARGKEMHKAVLQKLVLACLTVIILNSVSYATVCGTELCQLLNEFNE